MLSTESFLRGGTPCTEVPQLIEVLTTAGTSYSQWRVIAYYPRRWYHDAVENKITAPLFFLVFARCASAASKGVASQSTHGSEGAAKHRNAEAFDDVSSWHLLCHTVLPNGALPKEKVESEGVGDGSDASERVTSGGGGVGALRTLLRTIPAGLHPSESLEWFSVVSGEAYARMGLLSPSVFEQTLVPALATVLRLHLKANPNMQAGATRASTSAYYVHDSETRAGTTHLHSHPQSSQTTLTAHRVFMQTVVRGAVEWMGKQANMAAFVVDASGPSITSAGWEQLYPLVSTLPPCLYTSFFQEAAHVVDGPRAPLPDPETLTGLAKLRAEREVGMAQWKRMIGEFTTFTVPDTAAADMGREREAAAVKEETKAQQPSSVSRPFQHVLLLQRPIEAKKHIDVDNRDPGPLAPQPIGAELHLLQDRGDVLYTQEQLQNRSNVRFTFADTVHDDGEVFVQLAPVEGIPFCDLEEYFRGVPASSPVCSSAPASQCLDSCCAVVVPKVVFRRPTGKVQKANPMAHAQTELEVLSPTPEMVAAAVSALQYLGAHVCPIEKDAETAAKTTASSKNASSPTWGYTLRVSSVVFTLVPPKRCGWCGRRRELLLRCGSCKAVSYCCKRHQALDWKEGSHKTECKLWRRARELHEVVVAPWAAQAASTWTTPASAGAPKEIARGLGWSAAATLMNFMAAVEAELSRTRLSNNNIDTLAAGDNVRHLHVVGLDATCVEDFVSALAALLSVSISSSSSPQYRILVCSDTFTEAQRNAVWAVRRSRLGNHNGDGDGEGSTHWLTGSSGILGDAWHCEGGSAADTNPSTCAALIRLHAVKYHTVERVQANPTIGATPSKNPRPAAVLSFGPPNGDGCTYLHAALEVLADQDVGMVPVRLVDSSYVGAVRTRDALIARIGTSDTCTASIKSRSSRLVTQAKQMEAVEVTSETAALYTAAPALGESFQIRFNKNGTAPLEMGAAAVPDGGDASPAAEEMREKRAGSALPHFANSYFFDIFPSDY